jgi:hypothetical protein
MKTKRLPKKLGLNKKTIVDLNKQAMNLVKGGTWGTGTSCEPCETMSCNTGCFMPDTRCVCTMTYCVDC